MDQLGDAGEAAVHQVSGALESLTKRLRTFVTWDNIFKLAGIILILLAMWIIYKVVTHYVRKIPQEKITPHTSMIVLRVIRYAFYILVAMYVLSLFGIKLSAIWGAAGVAGIAVAFAAQTSVSNIISGVFVIAEKALKIGDLITVAGETGIVDNVGLLSVKIHTLDNQMIRIPNSTIINSTLRNTSFFAKRRLNVSVSVSYNTDMQTALDTLAKAPSYCKSVLKDPAPLVWFDGFGDSGINLTLAVWFKSENFLAAKNEAFIAVKHVYDAAHIEIPYNKIYVNLFDGNDEATAQAKMTAKTETAKKASQKSSAKKRNSKASREMIEAESAKEYKDETDSAK